MPDPCNRERPALGDYPGAALDRLLLDAILLLMGGIVSPDTSAFLRFLCRKNDRVTIPAGGARAERAELEAPR